MGFQLVAEKSFLAGQTSLVGRNRLGGPSESGRPASLGSGRARGPCRRRVSLAPPRRSDSVGTQLQARSSQSAGSGSCGRRWGLLPRHSRGPPARPFPCPHLARTLVLCALFFAQSSGPLGLSLFGGGRAARTRRHLSCVSRRNTKTTITSCCLCLVYLFSSALVFLQLGQHSQLGRLQASLARPAPKPVLSGGHASPAA